MNSWTNQTLILMLIVLILFSGLFSAIETAYSSASRIRLKAMDHDKADAVLAILEDFETFISTVLVGNNIVNILSATLATILFTRLYGDTGAIISTAVMTIAVLLFGEIAPKTIAKQSPESFAVHTVGFVKFFKFLLRPLTLIFGGWQWLVTKMQ